MAKLFVKYEDIACQSKFFILVWQATWQQIVLSSAYTGVAAQWLASYKCKAVNGIQAKCRGIINWVWNSTALNPTQLSIIIIYYNLHIYQALSAEKKRKAMKKAILWWFWYKVIILVQYSVCSRKPHEPILCCESKGFVQLSRLWTLEGLFEASSGWLAD